MSPKKIRSKSDLIDSFTEETSWRKRDLNRLKFDIEKVQKKETLLDYNLRIGISMLYAHWEGWIKSLGELYISYLNSKSIPLSEVSDNLLASSIKSSIINIDKSNKHRIHFEIVPTLTNLNSEVLRISEVLIDTGSNLNWERFEDILEKLGINSESYKPNNMLIDKHLLKNRNSIAHGEYVALDYLTFLTIYDKIFEMLKNFTDDLTNLVELEGYRK